jgi:hypothetical protein
MFAMLGQPRVKGILPELWVVVFCVSFRIVRAVSLATSWCWMLRHTQYSSHWNDGFWSDRQSVFN